MYPKCTLFTLFLIYYTLYIIFVKHRQAWKFCIFWEPGSEPKKSPGAKKKERKRKGEKGRQKKREEKKKANMG